MHTHQHKSNSKHSWGEVVASREIEGERREMGEEGIKEFVNVKTVYFAS